MLNVTQEDDDENDDNGNGANGNGDNGNGDNENDDIKNDDDDDDGPQTEAQEEDEEEEGGSIQALIEILPLAAPILEDLSDVSKHKLVHIDNYTVKTFITFLYSCSIFVFYILIVQYFMVSIPY